MPSDIEIPIGQIGAALQLKLGGAVAKLKGAFPAIVKQAADEVLQKAKELAPYETGRLEDSGTFVVEGTDASVSFDTEYAARVHELPELSVGPGTAAKPGNELGPAGPKYLERPLLWMAETRLEQITNEHVSSELSLFGEVVEAVETVAEIV